MNEVFVPNVLITHQDNLKDFSNLRHVNQCIIKIHKTCHAAYSVGL